MLSSFCNGRLALCTALVAGACAYAPNPPADATLRAAARTATDQGVTVSATVLTAEQAEAAFDSDLDGAGIQAIWLEIENEEDASYVLLSRNLDSRYYTPAEAAIQVHRFFADDAALDAFFRDRAIPTTVPPHATVSGYAYVPVARGYRVVSVDLLGSKRLRRFGFFLHVGGIKADYEGNALAEQAKEAAGESLDLPALRAAVEALASQVTDENAKRAGDPLNLVIVGRGIDVFSAFLRMGWDPTEVIDFGTAYQSTMSIVAGTKYRYAPFSSLYLFGRPQDIGLQKTRETVHERSHLRLWLTPWNYEGKPVWVGQASRDIGLKFTTSNWALFTHVLDPDVDRERQYVVQELIASQAVEQIGFAKGGIESSLAAPQTNLGGDEYYTDGLRAVLFLGPSSTPYTGVEFLDWETRGFKK